MGKIHRRVYSVGVNITKPLASSYSIKKVGGFKYTISKLSSDLLSRYINTVTNSRVIGIFRPSFL